MKESKDNVRRDNKVATAAVVAQKTGYSMLSFKSSFKTFGGGQSFTLLDHNSNSNTFVHPKATKYAIKFSIVYCAEPAEKLAVVGSIKELGEWK